MRAMRFGVCALLVTVILGAAPGTSWAPRVKLLPANGLPCAVGEDPGDFVGTFGLQSFTVQGGVPMAVGSLVGTCSTDTADVPVPDSTVVAVPFKVTATCDEIDLQLGEATFPAGATKMKLGGFAVALKADSNGTRGMMCAFTNQLRVRPVSALVPDLNRIFVRLP
jgi:hypothetical protein